MASGRLIDSPRMEGRRFASRWLLRHPLMKLFVILPMRTSAVLGTPE